MSLYFGLHLLGDADAFNHVLSLLSAKDYLTRCAAANILIEFSSADNINQIIHFLENANKNEETVAARSSIENALKYLKSSYNSK